MKLADQIVLVTGANRGLGRALVIAALDAGATRVYAGTRSLAAHAPLPGDAAERVVPIELDITSDASLAAAAARAGDVTVLVNNAGIFISPGVLASSPAQLAQEFATNVFGTLAATKAFLPALLRAPAGGAAIVNVLSVVSLASLPGLGAYSAAKAASYSLTQGLRADLAKQRVAVHAVFAGAIDTDMVRGMDMPKTSPDIVARGIVEGVERGDEDIAPDPMARELYGIWRRDPKQLERTLAAMGG